MMCYRDMTFCSDYQACARGNKCHRALTQQVVDDAKEWWGKEGAPICRFGEQPKCFEEEE